MSNQNPQADQNPKRPAAPRARRPEGVEGAPDRAEATNAPTSPGQDRSADSDDAIRFDGQRNAPPRETQATSPVPKLASGMFLPVVVLLVVGIILILVFVF